MGKLIFTLKNPKKRRWVCEKNKRLVVEKPEQSITAFIPLFFGVILLICNKGLKNESKLIAHIAVFVTLIALIGLTMPFKAAFYEGRTFSMFRVGAMILTGILAMTTFVKSFIKARQRK